MGVIQALVIDDNAQNLKVLAQLLTRQGVHCTTVQNAVHLPSLLAQLERVDVVFLDLEMPGQNGYEVKEALRMELGDTPIIAYTVHSNEINTVRQSGFDGFLGKPLDNGRFPEQLARILKREPVWERA